MYTSRHRIINDASETLSPCALKSSDVSQFSFSISFSGASLVTHFDVLVRLGVLLDSVRSAPVGSG
jgi:hypothetical protein